MERCVVSLQLALCPLVFFLLILQQWPRFLLEKVFLFLKSRISEDSASRSQRELHPAVEEGLKD